MMVVMNGVLALAFGAATIGAIADGKPLWAISIWLAATIVQSAAAGMAFINAQNRKEMHE